MPPLSVTLDRLYYTHTHRSGRSQENGCRDPPLHGYYRGHGHHQTRRPPPGEKRHENCGGEKRREEERRGEKRRDEGKRGRGVTAPHVCAEVELCSCRCVQKRDEPFLTTSSSPHSSPLHPPSSHMFRPPFLLLPLRLPALLSSSVLSSTLSVPEPVRGGANSRSSAVPYSTSTPMSA